MRMRVMARWIAVELRITLDSAMSWEKLKFQAPSSSECLNLQAPNPQPSGFGVSLFGASLVLGAWLLELPRWDEMFEAGKTDSTLSRVR
jgi:hypothetical protein